MLCSGWLTGQYQRCGVHAITGMVVAKDAGEEAIDIVITVPRDMQSVCLRSSSLLCSFLPRSKTNTFLILDT
jgi:hypothetical protein